MGVCVLVADDDPEVREFVETAVRCDGLDVIAAADGHEALARLRAGGVDLALLDARIPGIGGLELCRLLRAGATVGPRLPVVIMTGLGDADVREAVRDAGADAFLRKPFGFEDLMAEVRRRLRGPAGAVAVDAARLG